MSDRFDAARVTALCLMACTIGTAAADPHGEPVQYTVAVVSGPHGHAEPASQQVDEGAVATVAVVPDPGYEAVFDGFNCSAEDNGDGTWTTAPVGADCTMKADFVLSAADVLFQGDWDPDVVSVDDLDASLAATILGTSINWQTGAVCRGTAAAPCDTTRDAFHLRPVLSFPVLGRTYLVFRYPTNTPEPEYGVVVDADGNAPPLAPGTVIGPDQLFGYPTANAQTAAWRSAAGVDGYLGFRFRSTVSGRVNYGYAHLVTSGAPAPMTPSGFPARIVGYTYNRRGDPIESP